MARSPTPIRPRSADARDYEKAMRRDFINPFFRRLRKKLAQAAAANQAYRAMDEAVGEMKAEPVEGVPVREIQKALDRMRSYSRARVRSTFRAALGVDIGPILQEADVLPFMVEKIGENVDLIRLLPDRAKDGLKTRLREMLQKAPFDQNMLMRAFRKEYQVTGWNLRRITRDQNSKTVSGLNQIRQVNLGITQYKWQTSGDDRVRPTHVANSDKTFSWDDPPSATGHPGHDVLCRCLARSIIPDEAAKDIRKRVAIAAGSAAAGLAGAAVGVAGGLAGGALGVAGTVGTTAAVAGATTGAIGLAGSLLPRMPSFPTPQPTGVARLLQGMFPTPPTGGGPSLPPGTLSLAKALATPSRRVPTPLTAPRAAASSRGPRSPEQPPGPFGMKPERRASDISELRQKRLANQAAPQLDEEFNQHWGSWGDAVDEVYDAVGKTPPLEYMSFGADGVLAQNTSYYNYAYVQIHLDFTETPFVATRRSVWRHEFGHHMDFVLNTRYGRFYSEKKSFLKALRKDYDRLDRQEFLGDGPLESRNRPGVLEAKARMRTLSVLPDDLRAMTIKSEADKAGIDLGELDNWLRYHTAVGYRGAGELPDAAKDMIRWRFLRAWNDRDPQSMVDALFLATGDPKMKKWVTDNAKTSAMFSDFMEQITKGRSYGEFAHGADYYRRFPPGRATEAFANIVAMAGSDPLSARLAERFAPATYRRVMAGLKRMGKAKRKIDPHMEELGVEFEAPILKMSQNRVLREGREKRHPYGRIEIEEDLHEESWGRANKEMRQAVVEMRPLGRVTRYSDELSYYDIDERRIQFDPKGYSSDAVKRGFWRHEYGHAIDDSLHPERGRFSSTGARFERAIQNDYDRLNRKWKLEDKSAYTTREAAKERIKKDSHRFRDLDEAAQKAEIREQARKAGIDLDELDAYLHRETAIGYNPDPVTRIMSGQGALSESRKDRIRYRFLKAWNDLDAQNMADTYSLSVGKDMGFWLDNNAPDGQMFSDFMQALTRERVYGRYGHPIGYYDADWQARGTELFANAVSMIGNGPMGARVVERFAPEIYREVRSGIRRMGSGRAPKLLAPKPAPVPKVDVDKKIERLGLKKIAADRKRKNIEWLKRESQIHDWAKSVVDEMRNAKKIIKKTSEVDNLTKALQETFSPEKTAQYMAIRRTALRKVVDDGFKNSYQTGKGTFETVGQERFEKIEKPVFGLKDDALKTPDDLPKYGFIAGKENMDWDKVVGMGYGETFVRFKPGVRRRSTITITDSFDGNSSAIRFNPATPLNDVSSDLVSGSASRLVIKVPAEAEALYRGRWQAWGKTHDYKDLADAAGSRYVETQIFGKLDMNDVDAVIVESKKELRNLRRLLDRKGHKDIDVIPGRHHTRLKQIWDGDTAGDEASISQDDLDRFGDPWMDKLVRGSASGVLTGRWKDLPESIKVFQRRFKEYADWRDAPAQLKREYLSEYTRLMALKEKGGLPKVHWKEYRPSKTGFTADVANEALLERYTLARPARAPSVIKVSKKIEQLQLKKVRNKRRKEILDSFERRIQNKLPISQAGFIDIQMLKDGKKAIQDVIGGHRLKPALQETFSSERVAQYMAINEDNLLKALTEGFKNSYQTGKGSFGIIAQRRFELYEKPIYGLKEDILKTPDEMPKYGFISGKNNMDLERMVGIGYGDIFVRFKPTVRRRSTITFYDSLVGNKPDTGRITPPVPLNDVTDDLFDSATEGLMRGGAKEKNDAIEKWKKWWASRDYKDFDTTYIETQMFGKLDMNDVDAIVLDSKKQMVAIRKALENGGFDDVRIIPSNYHERLGLIWRGDRRGFGQSLSLKDLDRLGDPWMNKLMKGAPGQILTRGGADTPESIVNFRKRFSAHGPNWRAAPASLKREFLREYIRLMSLGEKGGLPREHWVQYSSSQTNFTADVLNEDLLRRYE